MRACKGLGKMLLGPSCSRIWTCTRSASSSSRHAQACVTVRSIATKTLLEKTRDKPTSRLLEQGPWSQPQQATIEIRDPAFAVSPTVANDPTELDSLTSCTEQG